MRWGALVRSAAGAAAAAEPAAATAAAEVVAAAVAAAAVSLLGSGRGELIEVVADVGLELVQAIDRVVALDEDVRRSRRPLVEEAVETERQAVAAHWGRGCEGPALRRARRRRRRGRERTLACSSLHGPSGRREGRRRGDDEEQEEDGLHGTIAGTCCWGGERV